MLFQRRLGNSNLFLNIIAVALACTLWKSSWVAGSSVKRYCKHEILNGVSFKAECILDNETVSCNDHIKPGTIAKLSCSPNYQLRDRGYAEQTIHCDESGDWDYPPPRCEQICGEVSAPMTNKSFMPWHVGVYQNIAGKYKYNCGGTIINAKLIISVAHCLWDEANQSIRDTSSYTIGAGVLHREFNANESKGTQLRNISNVVIPLNYMGAGGNLVADISIIVLSNPLQFSMFVAPVCIHWENHGAKDFQNNLHGTLAIWGKGESEGNELKTISVPGSSYDVCQTETEGPTNLTTDKFCLLNKSNEIPCLGDSGTGFVVQKLVDGKPRHFLMGVVSAGWPSPQNNNCSNVLFISTTNIQFYEDFITNLESRHIPKY